MDIQKTQLRIGVGTDIENIARFDDKTLAENRAFLDKIFTEAELTYCFSKGKAAQHLAGRFCAKEAVSKALNCTGRKNIEYNNIEIFNNEDGVPNVRINRTDCTKLKIHLSISHCEDKAVAFAMVMDVAEDEDG